MSGSILNPYMSACVIVIFFQDVLYCSFFFISKKCIMRSKEQEVFNPHDICVIVDLSYFNLSFKKSYFNLLFLIFLYINGNITLKRKRKKKLCVKCRFKAGRIWITRKATHYVTTKWCFQLCMWFLISYIEVR
jgi:hypothetical protein